MRFQQQAKLRELLQVLHRDRRDLEAAAAFRQHKAFRGEPIEDFAQRGDADAIVFLEAFKPELLPRAQPAEHDVGPDAAIAVIADCFLLFSPLDQCHCQIHARAATGLAMPADSSQASRSILYNTFHMMKSVLYFDISFTI